MRLQYFIHQSVSKLLTRTVRHKVPFALPILHAKCVLAPLKEVPLVRSDVLLWKGVYLWLVTRVALETIDWI